MKNQKKEFEISLPFFCGFYESRFENCDTEWYAINDHINYIENEGEMHEYDDFEFDNERRRNDICEAFLDAFKNHAPSFIEDAIISELWSPNYYNFENDRLYAYVTLSDDWKEQVRTFIDEHRDELEKTIRNEWSSRSGFISFMSNDVSEWYGKILDDEDTRYISEIVKYMMMMQPQDVFDEIEMCEIIENETLEDIYDEDYVVLAPKMLETA